MPPFSRRLGWGWAARDVAPLPQNLGTAAASLQAAVPAVLGFVVGKPIAEL